MVSFSLLNALDPTTIVFIVLLGILILGLFIVPPFTNRRAEKKFDKLHSSLQPGDVIETIGGIIGTVVEIRQVSPVDKEMVIETGIDDRKTTMVFDIQALYQVISRNSTIVPVKDESEAEADEAALDHKDESSKVVPEITAEPEVKEEVTIEPVAEQSAVAEEPAIKDDVEPEQANSTPEPAVQKKPEQKNGAKKSKSNNGSKKNRK